MRDFKDSAAADYSSKAAERMQEAGTKLGDTAESVTKGAEAAKETLQNAYQTNVGTGVASTSSF